jgi:hypothetical protein
LFGWFLQNGLALGPSKMEIILLDTGQRLARFNYASSIIFADFSVMALPLNLHSTASSKSKPIILETALLLGAPFSTL